MPLWRLLAHEISTLVDQGNAPEETIELIEQVLRKYRRYEIFWPKTISKAESINTERDNKGNIGADVNGKEKHTIEDKGYSPNTECQDSLAESSLRDQSADIHTLSSDDYGIDWLTGKYTDKKGRLKRELQRLNSRGYSLYD